MRKSIMLLSVLFAAALFANPAFAEKKKTQPAKPAAAPDKKKQHAEVLVGQLKKTTEDNKAKYELTTDKGGQTYELSQGQAKAISMNLDEYVDKSIAVTVYLSDDKAKVTKILTMKTAAEYRKQGGKL